MSRDDISRWDKRYSRDIEYATLRPREILLQSIDLLPSPGIAIDFACGLGMNSSYLISHGWKVIGIDASYSAIQLSKKHNPALLAVQADLEQYYLPTAHFDLILVFYYFQPNLLEQFTRIIKPGGMVIVETFTLDMLRQKNDIDPKYLLEPRELYERFNQWTILRYFEGWIRQGDGKNKAIARIVAKI